jgi:hypothetical protein
LHAHPMNVGMNRSRKLIFKLGEDKKCIPCTT